MGVEQKDQIILSKKRKKSKKSRKEHDGEDEEKKHMAMKVDTVTEDEPPKKKKKKKKKRKAEDADPTHDAPAKVAGDSEETKTKKKKKKKSKKQDSDIEVSNGVVTFTDTNNDSCGGLQKNFYNPSSAVLNMPRKTADAYRKEHEVEVEMENPPAPITAFKDSGLPKDILRVTTDFDKPSPIQAQCWPLVLQGKDVIGIAATGSGKTFAFGLPGLVHARSRGRVSPHKPFFIVIAPTRELAVQTSKQLELASATADPPMRALCVYGGVPKGPQIKALKQGVHTLVATPGRLVDLMNDRFVDLSDATYCVLDEADRMLDMGFEKDIRNILGATSSQRQTVMFSATWPVEVKSIARSYMKNAVRVTVGSTDLSANHDVEQIVEVIEPFGKDKRLSQLLQKYHSSRTNRILVFCLYKKEAARVEQNLIRKGFNAAAIHGDLSQQARTDVLANFKSGQCPLLIATDVAARGLDIPQIEYVINYTFPLTIEDYVHRIGRTGRAGAKGVSHTLFTVHDKLLAGALGNVLREAGVEVPESLMKFGQHTKRKVNKTYGVHFREDLVGLVPKKKTFDD